MAVQGHNLISITLPQNYFLTRLAISKSSSYPIILARLDGPSSRTNLYCGSTGNQTRDLTISNLPMIMMITLLGHLLHYCRYSWAHRNFAPPQCSIFFIIFCEALADILLLTPSTDCSLISLSLRISPIIFLKYANNDNRRRPITSIILSSTFIIYLIFRFFCPPPKLHLYTQ